MPLEDPENDEGESMDQTIHRKQKPNSVAPFLVDGKNGEQHELKRRKTNDKERCSSISDAASNRSSVSKVTGRVVAETFDRLIFCILLAVSLLTTVACLLALGVGAIKTTREHQAYTSRRR
nr:hypothetical protein BaRGS_016850 [Batillaria attramentaria]